MICSFVSVCKKSFFESMVFITRFNLDDDAYELKINIILAQNTVFFGYLLFESPWLFIRFHILLHFPLILIVLNVLVENYSFLMYVCFYKRACNEFAHLFHLNLLLIVIILLLDLIEIKETFRELFSKILLRLSYLILIY